MKTPECRYSADTYTFSWDDEQVHIILDRIQEKRDDLIAELEVRCSRDVPNALVHHARFNVLSTVTRGQVAKACADRTPQHDIDWAAALEMVCHLTLTRWREGDPFVDLREVAPRQGSRYLLAPFIEDGGPTILFAEGGVGKSLFGLALAATIASGKAILGVKPTRTEAALYLDWESDAETHGDRLRALCAGATLLPASPAVFYRRQAASLSESAAHIRKFIAAKRIGFVIVDSMGAARGGEPESADSTIRLFNAARSLGVPWLGIDHVTKNGGIDQTKPFGSVYTVNLARLTWRLERVGEDTDDGPMTIVASNHKANNGRLEKRRAYRVGVEQDEYGRPVRATYSQTDVRDIPGILTRLDQPSQVAEILRSNRHPMTVEDIQLALEAEGVSVTRENVRAVLNRYRDKRFASLNDGRNQRWGLLAHV